MPHINSLKNDNELLRNHTTTQISDFEQAMVSHRVDTGWGTINLRDKMERKIRTLKLETEKSTETIEELRNDAKKSAEMMEELCNDLKKSAATTEKLLNNAKTSAEMMEELRNDLKRFTDMIKYDRNDISRKRTISETADYAEGNSEEAPGLRKRRYVENQGERIVVKICLGTAQVNTITN
jgi:uncharacterized membrane-anchored protein YhcB (DUF1043 family)